MLNDVKVDLLWGRNSEEQPEELSVKQQQQQEAQQPQQTQIQIEHHLSVEATSKPQSVGQLKGHVRCPSTASVASSNSINTLSDTESDISNENDSGIESETHRETDKSADLARHYRTHLLGLYRCLEQMTEAANYLTNRYQNDVGQV